MANPKRGDVDLDAPNGKRYTLRLTTNAACDVQKRTGKTLRDLFLAAMLGDNILTREFVWLLLQPYHATEFDSLEKVGDFMDEWPLLGDNELSKAVAHLLELNQPPQKPETPGGTKSANPPDAQAGISAGASSLTLVGSA